MKILQVNGAHAIEEAEEAPVVQGEWTFDVTGGTGGVKNAICW